MVSDDVSIYCSCMQWFYLDLSDHKVQDGYGMEEVSRLTSVHVYTRLLGRQDEVFCIRLRARVRLSKSISDFRRRLQLLSAVSTARPICFAVPH